MKAFCLLLILIQVMMIKGDLTITAVKGSFTRNTELILNMDPYIKFMDGTHQFKTRVHRGGGMNPIWNEEFYIERGTPFFVFWVYDEDVFSDDLIGKGSLNLQDECKEGCYIEEGVPIYYKGEEVGLIYLNIQFTPYQMSD